MLLCPILFAFNLLFTNGAGKGEHKNLFGFFFSCASCIRCYFKSINIVKCGYFFSKAKMTCTAGSTQVALLLKKKVAPGLRLSIKKRLFP